MRRQPQAPPSFEAFGRHLDTVSRSYGPGLRIAEHQVLAAQQEYLETLKRRGDDDDPLLSAARQRLSLWDLSDAAIDAFIDEQAERIEEKMLSAGGLEPGDAGAAARPGGEPRPVLRRGPDRTIRPTA